MNRALLLPLDRILAPIRMPTPQRPAASITREFQDSLRDPQASVRLLKTTGKRIVLGPMSSPQSFVRDGGPNTSIAMSAPRKQNARRLLGKTHSSARSMS